MWKIWKLKFKVKLVKGEALSPKDKDKQWRISVRHNLFFLPAQNSELLGSPPQTQVSMTDGDWTELSLQLWHVWVGMEELKKKEMKLLK